MKWKKLRKIFDPTKYNLSNECIEFAKSPQTLVFDNFVRIYFSAQKKSSNGKYVSHIQYIDMDKSFKEIINTSSDTVIGLGKIGTFDEHGIFPINILRYQDKVYAYTCGWSRRDSVPIDMSIGLAISDDNGLTFKKFGEGPVLTASLYEPFLVGDAFVKIYNNVFHMWYIYGTEWRFFSGGSEPDRTYVIGHATSKDGINWHKESKQIISSKYENECQALPTVIKIGSRYHMIFCHRHSFDFRKNRDHVYRLGYAYSDDLMKWMRDDRNIGIDTTEGSWDSDMLCYPHVFECGGKIYLLYNGNEFGRYGFGLAELEDKE